MFRRERNGGEDVKSMVCVLNVEGGISENRLQNTIREVKYIHRRTRAGRNNRSTKRINHVNFYIYMAFFVFADSSEAKFYACFAWATSMENVPCPVAQTPSRPFCFTPKEVNFWKHVKHRST
jgi:siroheme synthase (precorrin-2 oxidase/ferrochelatase)